MEKKYKWTKPKNIFTPKMKYLVDAWWKNFWEEAKKMRRWND